MADLPSSMGASPALCFPGPLPISRVPPSWVSIQILLPLPAIEIQVPRGPSPFSGLTSSFLTHLWLGVGDITYSMTLVSNLSTKLNTLRSTCISNPHLFPDLQTQKCSCLPGTPLICPQALPHLCVSRWYPFSPTEARNQSKDNGLSLFSQHPITVFEFFWFFL